MGVNINLDSILGLLVAAGIALAYLGPTGQYMMDYPLWQFLLGIGLIGWAAYNIPNIMRQF